VGIPVDGPHPEQLGGAEGQAAPHRSPSWQRRPAVVTTRRIFFCPSSLPGPRQESAAEAPGAAQNAGGAPRGRASWTGLLQLSLVVVPVKLPATLFKFTPPGAASDDPTPAPGPRKFCLLKRLGPITAAFPAMGYFPAAVAPEDAEAADIGCGGVPLAVLRSWESQRNLSAMGGSLPEDCGLESSGVRSEDCPDAGGKRFRAPWLAGDRSRG